MVLDNFYEFIEDQVEILTPEEKVARNNIIITESALEEVKELLEEWLGDNIILYRCYDYENPT
jgi:nitrogen-specific signal transduction histidine kinase